MWDYVSLDNVAHVVSIVVPVVALVVWWFRKWWVRRCLIKEFEEEGKFRAESILYNYIEDKAKVDPSVLEWRIDFHIKHRRAIKHYPKKIRKHLELDIRKEIDGWLQSVKDVEDLKKLCRQFDITHD